jgi:hypothetical protein
MTGSGKPDRTCRRPELAWAWLLDVRGVVGDGGLIGTVFSAMVPSPKASSMDSKEGDRCKPVAMAESKSIPGSACWGVSAATGNPSCVLSMCTSCGDGRVGLAGIAES